MKSMIQRLSTQALCAAALALSLSPSAMAAGDAEAGAKKAETCLGCHGVEHYVNTYPTYKVPRVAGQHEAYIVAALQAYRAKTRSHQTMQANAANLSDQDIADIAAFFESRGNADFKAGDPKTGPDSAATCASCHGPDGNSPTGAFPILAGQYQDYLVQALKQYQSNERSGTTMSAFAGSLTDADIEELASWFSSQPSRLQFIK